ncbi:MAG: TetR family transcriptional regulator C-terminal domain-containing protein, partial [Trebonia sp.]
AHPRDVVAFFEIAAGSRSDTNSRGDTNSQGDTAVSAVVAALAAGVAAALREMIAGGQASGEFRADFDPQAVATAIIAVVEAIPPRMARDPDFDVAGYGREIAGLFDAATRSAAPATRSAAAVTRSAVPATRSAHRKGSPE